MLTLVVERAQRCCTTLSSRSQVAVSVAGTTSTVVVVCCVSVAATTSTVTVVGCAAAVEPGVPQIVVR